MKPILTVSEYESKNMDSKSGKGMLDVNEVARLIKVDVNTVMLWSKLGILKSHSVGNSGKRVFRRSDLTGFLTREDDDRNKYTKEITHPPEN